MPGFFLGSSKLIHPAVLQDNVQSRQKLESQQQENKGVQKVGAMD